MLSRPNPLVDFSATTFGRRDLSSQSITSIANGAFTGLGNLTSLYVAVMSPVLVHALGVAQLSEWKSDHNDIKRSIHRTGQSDVTV